MEKRVEPTPAVLTRLPRTANPPFVEPKCKSFMVNFRVPEAYAY